MDTSISREVRADPRIVFNLAAQVQDWPRILPHYRWVRVLANERRHRRTVEMAARRDVLLGVVGVPLWWTAIETTYPEAGRIEFEHVGGITRGMQVAWTIEPLSDSTVRVAIRHVFEPGWPVPPALVRLIVGEYFVNSVARRTLRGISDLAEARTSLQGISGAKQQA
jgi:ribosome-associated toxin RatA of RatAB toxin-antitoxin module